MGDDLPLLDQILGLVPQNLREVPGSLLYSGRDAFANGSALYLMGINPGGDPIREPETVAAHARKVLRFKPANFSEYRDGCWPAPGHGGPRPPGSAPMQQRVLHLLDTLALDPGTVPASNLVFARSRREGHIPPEQMRAWAEECWPFHQAMIKRLGARVIVCFGGTVGDFVRAKVGAREKSDQFTEGNNRRWTSRTFRGDGGIRVVQATHPSIADWCNPATDMSPLVMRALSGTGT